MFARVLRNRGRRLRWALFSSVALASYFIAAIGLPVPEPLALAEGTGQPYPCQNHRCGCLNAEQCWTHCCCFTPDQKLAWARANGVRPPNWAEEIRTSGWNTPRLRDKQQSKTCCHCAGCGSDSTRDASAPPESARVDNGKKRSPFGWILSVSAAGCRGLATLWLTLGGVTGPPPVARWQPDLRACERMSPLDLRPCSLEHAPLTPPPRPFSSVTG
jgi:hypothetical protein